MPTAAGLYYFIHNPDLRERPPVLLIHGAGNTHLSWSPDIRRMPGQRVLAVDLPGHGRTSGLGCQSISAYAQSILNLMDELGYYNAVLVGHSMGGAIALQLALTQPDRVLALGLIASGGRLRVMPAVLEALENPALVPQAISAIVEWSYGTQASAALKQLAVRMLSETRPAVLLGDLQACNEFDVLARLPEIQKPTLIVCGTEDRMTPLRHAQSMAGSIPGAALQTIPEAGHMVMLEQPRRVAGILNIFLNSLNYIPGV